MCTSVPHKSVKVGIKKKSCLSRCPLILFRSRKWLLQKKLTAYNTQCSLGEKKNLFHHSTTHLRFVVFQLCHRKGSHSQEDFQRLIHLFIKGKKKLYGYNGRFLNRAPPKSHHRTPLVQYFPAHRTASLSPSLPSSGPKLQFASSPPDALS